MVMGERVRTSNHRIFLSSQAVIRTLRSPPQIIDLIVFLWTPGPISYPGGCEAWPFVPNVGLVGEEELLLGAMPDCDKSYIMSFFSKPPVARICGRG